MCSQSGNVSKFDDAVKSVIENGNYPPMSTGKVDDITTSSGQHRHVDRLPF